MGGPGSGRRPTRLAVEECRALAIGELCDGGRLAGQPRGEVLWRADDDGATRARLSYALTQQQETNDSAESLLVYRYWPQGSGLSSEHELVLEGRRGRRILARCPTCGRCVRALYAPPGARRFRCRSCCGLVYRRTQRRERLLYLQEVAGPMLADLEALPQRVRHLPWRQYVERPPEALARRLEEELPLAPQELRLWCLRLRAAGLSYRQIAALTESSKSSVARFCLAGRGGIDRLALMRERLERDATGPRAPEDDDPAALNAYLGALHRHALRLGLYRLPATEPEERVVIPAESISES